MSGIRFHPGVVAVALSLLVAATVALTATTLDAGSDGGELRLLIGAATGLGLLVLANFAIIEDETGGA